MQGIADAVTPKNNLASHPILQRRFGARNDRRSDALEVVRLRRRAFSRHRRPRLSRLTPMLWASDGHPAPPSKFRRHRQRSGPCGLGWTRETSELGLSRSGRESPQVEGWRRRDPGRVSNGPSLMTSALVGDGRPMALSPPSQRGATIRREEDRPGQCPAVRSEWRDDDERRRQCALQPLNPESCLHATGFDPTKQQFAPGAGAISNAAGKTLHCSRHLGLQARRSPLARWMPTETARHAPTR